MVAVNGGRSEHGSTHYDSVYGYDTDTYDSVTFVIDTSVSNGTINFDTISGSFDYTPTAGWTGSDYFEFHVVDALGAVSTTERFDFTVYNTDPTASGGSASILHDTTHYDSVYGSDSDMYDSVTFVIDTSVSNGTLNFDTMSGSFDYTPTAGWIGSDYFEFHVVDVLGAVSTTERFDFTVYNNVPVANDDDGQYYSVANMLTLSVTAENGVLINDYDSDPEDDPNLTASLVTQAAYGTVALAGDGSFNYTPTLAYAGWDSFIYRVFDGVAYSNLAQVKIGRNEYFIVNLTTSSGTDLTDLSTYSAARVGENTTTDLWVGELVTMTVGTDGPNPGQVSNFSWTIGGSPVEDIAFGAEQTFGGIALPSTGNPVPLSAAWYTSDPIQFNWLEGRVFTSSVTVDVAGLANPISLSTNHNVKVPTVNGTVNMGTIQESTFLGIRNYSLGSAAPGATPGIDINASITTGPAGSLSYIQHWAMTTQAEFPVDPGAIAAPSLGPGSYGATLSGLDAIVFGSNFNDSPGFNIPDTIGAVPGAASAYVNYSASFQNYIMFQSAAPGSLPAAVKVINWSWTVSITSTEIGPPGSGYYAWDPPVSNTTWSAAAASGFPSWTQIGKKNGPTWEPWQ